MIFPKIIGSTRLSSWLMPASTSAATISHFCGFRYFQRIIIVLAKRRFFFLLLIYIRWHKQNTCLATGDLGDSARPGVSEGDFLKKPLYPGSSHDPSDPPHHKGDRITPSLYSPVRVTKPHHGITQSIDISLIMRSRKQSMFTVPGCIKCHNR